MLLCCAVRRCAVLLAYMRSTMKRRLHDKLVLLVKAQSNALTAAAAAAAGGSSKASGSSSSTWTFPHTACQPGESIRQAAERALKETIGLSQVGMLLSYHSLNPAVN
jgi:ADP-ribose pyrophosphatase YjhB (NUDIX family)